MDFQRLSPEQQRLAWAVAAGAFLVAVAVIFFQNEAFYRDFQGYFSSPAPLAASRQARLTVDFGNGRKRAFAGEARGGMTVLSALRLAEAAGGFEAATDPRGKVTRIADVTNSGLKRWRISVNGVPISDLPGHTEIKPGDRITFRYE